MLGQLLVALVASRTYLTDQDELDVAGELPGHLLVGHRVALTAVPDQDERLLRVGLEQPPNGHPLVLGAAAPQVALRRTPVGEEHRPGREGPQLDELAEHVVERPAAGGDVEEGGFGKAAAGAGGGTSVQPPVQRGHPRHRAAGVRVPQQGLLQRCQSLGQPTHQDRVVDVGDDRERRARRGVDHPARARGGLAVLDWRRDRVCLVPAGWQFGHRQTEVRETTAIGRLLRGVVADPKLHLDAHNGQRPVPAQVRLGDVPVGDPAVARQLWLLGHPHPDLGHAFGDEAAIDGHMHPAEGTRLHLLLAPPPGPFAFDTRDCGSRLGAAQFRIQFGGDAAGQAGHVPQHGKRVHGCHPRSIS